MTSRNSCSMSKLLSHCMDCRKTKRRNKWITNIQYTDDWESSCDKWMLHYFNCTLFTDDSIKTFFNTIYRWAKIYLIFFFHFLTILRDKNTIIVGEPLKFLRKLSLLFTLSNYNYLKYVQVEKNTSKRRYMYISSGGEHVPEHEETLFWWRNILGEKYNKKTKILPVIK